MSRLDTFRALVAANPENALARFGLANEALKAGEYAEAIEHLRGYLDRHEDEGNAYGRLAEALIALGRTDEARDALRQGIDTAHRYGHPGMAADFGERLEEIADG